MLKLIRAHLKGLPLLCGILAPLCMFLEVFMDLQQPTLMSNIIDIGVARQDMSYVLQTGMRMILFAGLGLIGGAGCSILATYTATHMAASVRSSLFSKIFSLSSGEIDQLETSSLVTRTTNDVAQVRDMMRMLLRAMSRGPMLFLGGIIMAFTLSPKLALILCVILPLLIGCAVVILRKSVALYTSVQQRMDDVNNVTRENLLGIRVIKAFALEDKRFDTFLHTNQQYTQTGIQAQSTTILLMPIVNLIMNLSVVAVLWFGGRMEISGALPMGKIMAFINYLVQITNALLMLVRLSVNLSRSQASVQRINQVMETQVSVLPPQNPVLPKGKDIQFRNVTFGYGGMPVIKGVSFDLPAGQRVGLIGATGSGKSTIAALLARLYDPDQGEILMGGVNLRDIPTERLRKDVGIVLQNSLLFSGTVAENLRYGNRDATDAQLWSALQIADAAEFLQVLPEQLDAPVAQRGKNFSGGQKQRLSIARSLLQQPGLLLLDDTTSAVDFLTEARIQQGIQESLQGTTLLIIAQRVSSIMDCDTIFVMHNGELAAKGSHGELLKSSALYRSIAVSQLGEEVLQHV